MPFSPEQLRSAAKARDYQPTQEIIAKLSSLTREQQVALFSTLNTLLEAEKGNALKKGGLWVFLDLLGLSAITPIAHSLSESQAYLRLEAINRKLGELLK